MRTLLPLLLTLLTLASPISAQFGSFFDQMFGGGGHGHHQQHQQQHHGHGQQQHPNVPSDPSIYQANYQRAHCDKYLCPDTLGMSFRHSLSLLLFGRGGSWEWMGNGRGSEEKGRGWEMQGKMLTGINTTACVHYPHHCPCPWPSHEDKAELAEGQRICVSRGGFKAGEAARKIELARKGML